MMLLWHSKTLWGQCAFITYCICSLLFANRRTLETTDQRLLLAIQYACAMDKVKIPWAKVVKAMGGETTVSATIQHLTKLRKRLVNKGHDVPPPPHRAGDDRDDFGSCSGKEGDSYDSDGEEAFKEEEESGMARAKQAKRNTKDDYGDRLKVLARDDGRFPRSNLEIWEGDEGSMTSAVTLRE